MQNTITEKRNNRGIFLCFSFAAYQANIDPSESFPETDLHKYASPPTPPPEDIPFPDA